MAEVLTGCGGDSSRPSPGEARRAAPPRRGLPQGDEPEPALTATQGAVELAAEIERWLSGEPVAAWPEPWPDRARRWARRHRVLVSTAAAALVVGAAVLAVANSRLRTLARARLGNTQLRSALDSAEQNLYARDIELADRAWWDGEVDQAGRFLDECPAAHRGWEWHYLSRRNRPGLLSASLAGPLRALGFVENSRLVAVEERSASVHETGTGRAQPMAGLDAGPFRLAALTRTARGWPSSPPIVPERWSSRTCRIAGSRLDSRAVPTGRSRDWASVRATDP